MELLLTEYGARQDVMVGAGEQADVTIDLVSPASTGTISIDYDLTPLADVSLVHPRAHGIVSFGIGISAAGAEIEYLEAPLGLWSFDGAEPTRGHLERNLATLPPGWESFEYLFQDVIIVPGPDSTLQFGGPVYRRVDHRPRKERTVDFTPRLSSPRNLRVAGREARARAPLTSVGLTPEITWDAPSLGSADGYAIRVFGPRDSEAWTTERRGARDGHLRSRHTVTLTRQPRHHAELPPKERVPSPQILQIVLPLVPRA